MLMYLSLTSEEQDEQLQRKKKYLGIKLSFSHDYKRLFAGSFLIQPDYNTK